MSAILGNAIKAARIRMSLKQWEVADALGVTRAAVGQWEAGANDPSSANLMKLGELLGLDLTPALEHPTQVRSARNPNKQLDDEALFKKSEGFDVPISHIAAMDDGAVFDLELKVNVAYARRFEFFEHYPGIYAMLIATEILSPKFEQTDIVYVDPNNSPVTGEFGVFKFKKSFGKYSNIRRIFRKVVLLDEKIVILSQFHPDRRFDCRIEDIETMHRIIPERELVRARGK